MISRSELLAGHSVFTVCSGSIGISSALGFGSIMAILSLLMLAGLYSALVNATLVITLNSGQTIGQSEWRGPNPVKRVKYCVDCPNPRAALGYVVAMSTRYGMVDFDVTAELVYGVPNHGEGRKLLNRVEVEDRVVFLERGGGVSIIDKVRKAQKAGAVGVVVADDGQCDEGFVFCGTQAGSIYDGGFAAHENPAEWANVNLPVLLISSAAGEEMRQRMILEERVIPNMGVHNITVVGGFDLADSNHNIDL